MFSSRILHCNTIINDIKYTIVVAGLDNLGLDFVMVLKTEKFFGDFLLFHFSPSPVLSFEACWLNKNRTVPVKHVRLQSYISHYVNKGIWLILFVCH